MDWTEISLYDGEMTYWISGIYKVVRYNPDEYYAYYITPIQSNWGDRVGKPPCRRRDGNEYYDSLQSAQDACRNHSLTYAPERKTVRRALEIKEQLIAEHGKVAAA
jgi:hypothetical protein